MTDKAKKEIARYVNEKVLEDIFYVVKMYRDYEKIFEYITNNMKNEPIVEVKKYGILVVVAMNTLSLEEFKSKVLI